MGMILCIWEGGNMNKYCFYLMSELNGRIIFLEIVMGIEFVDKIFIR